MSATRRRRRTTPERRLSCCVPQLAPQPCSLDRPLAHALPALLTRRPLGRRTQQFVISLLHQGIVLPVCIAMWVAGTPAAPEIIYLLTGAYLASNPNPRPKPKPNPNPKPDPKPKPYPKPTPYPNLNLNQEPTSPPTRS